jgi:hypothetical protein
MRNEPQIVPGSSASICSLLRTTHAFRVSNACTWHSISIRYLQDDETAFTPLIFAASIAAYFTHVARSTEISMTHAEKGSSASPLIDMPFIGNINT